MAHSREYVSLMNSKEWRILRASFLTEHPLCACCESRGFVRSSRCVHHITPIESARTMEGPNGMRALAFAPTNLQALCFECHAAIHKAARSHSREAHQQREAERLERFKERLKKPQKA